MKQATGFTVTELLFAVGVLGILSTIAIPNYNAWLPKSRVNGAARELFTEMQFARMKAISENNNYVITFDTANNSYNIYDDENNDGDGQAGEWVKTINIQDNYPKIEFGYIVNTNPTGDAITEAVTFTGDRFAFRPTGLANKKGSVFLIPADSSKKDHQRDITVITTGRVRLYRYTGNAWE